MHTPAADYVYFWLAIFCGGGLLLCAWVWVFCALAALGSPHYWTWRRVLYAFLLGPMAVGDIMDSHRKW